MWRSLFLALGFFAISLGLECLIIERAILVNSRDAINAQTTELVPPDWAPWSLMSAGAIVVLYSFTLPKRLKGSG
jgi:hypothetical protein